jgi:phage baseplate assembly protein gpV
MKRKIALSLAAMMLVPAFGSVVNAQSQEVSVIVNGNNLEMTDKPVIENNRTLVPFRQITEELGAEVDWDAETKTITCTLDDKTVSLEIGSANMTTSDGNITLDVPAKVIDSRTYVPLRAVSEGLGAEVNWDAESKTITVATSASEADTATDSEVEIQAGKDGLNYSIKSYENSIKAGSKTIMPVTASYPSFKGNGRAVKKLNEVISNDAVTRATSYKTINSKRLYDLYQQCIKDGTRSSFANYAYSLSYEVKNDSDGIISLYVTEKIVSDSENSENVYCLNFNANTGNTITADDLVKDASDTAKQGLTDRGYDSLVVARLSLDDSSFYIQDGYMIYVVNAGVLDKNKVEYSIKLPELNMDTEALSYTTVDVETEKLTDQLLTHYDGIVMNLKATYPQFSGVNKNLENLNKEIKNNVADDMAKYKESVNDAALTAYKTYEDNRDKTNKKDKFEPWVYTVDSKVKYNNDEIASVLVSTYISKSDGTEATTYTAYTCNLKSGKIISVDDLIDDVTATDSKARAAFKQLIEGNRLSFYTSVYERFDLSRATKYISKDGVTYVFDPGVLASVARGPIEVTVPLN